MIHVVVDEFMPYLKDVKTGDFVLTEVIRLRRKSFLKKYNKENGWYIDWATLVDENEIYALVIEGSVDIQGLVAVTPDADMQALHIRWMCACPDSDRQVTDHVKYLGIGGQLFAIAAQKSMDFGFGGHMYGFAADRALLEHYVTIFHAEKIPILSPYSFTISGRMAKEIMEGTGMSEQREYEERLANMPEPVLLNQNLKSTLDLRGFMQYAEKKGVRVMDLTEEEKAVLIKE